MSEIEPEGRQVRIVWETDGDAPAPYANQFIAQHQPGEFFLSFGQLVPPALLGDDEDKMRQLDELSYVPVRLLGRIAVTRAGMERLVALLTENLKNHDDKFGGAA